MKILTKFKRQSRFKITSDGTIDSKMLSITSNEGSTLNLQVDVNLLNSKTNSGGIINVSGTARNSRCFW